MLNKHGSAAKGRLANVLFLTKGQCEYYKTQYLAGTSLGLQIHKLLLLGSLNLKQIEFTFWPHFLNKETVAVTHKTQVLAILVILWRATCECLFMQFVNRAWINVFLELCVITPISAKMICLQKSSIVHQIIASPLYSCLQNGCLLVFLFSLLRTAAV